MLRRAFRYNVDSALKRLPWVGEQFDFTFRTFLWGSHDAYLAKTETQQCWITQQPTSSRRARCGPVGPNRIYY
jgi:hypothetical protein